jgi:O-antigen/teichoic acid export membrane protein
MKITFTDGFKRYFANTSWLLGEKVFHMAAALFVGVYVARYLGPERFGLLEGIATLSRPAAFYATGR